MLAVSYKMPKSDGVVYIPCYSKIRAIQKAGVYFKKGFLNVKVVKLKEEILHIPQVDNIKSRKNR